MTDPTDSTITTASAYRSINNSDENNIDTASRTTYRTNATTNYTNPSTSGTTASLGVRSYDAIAAQDGGGHTAYDPETGAYDEHYDYRTRTAYGGDDATRHHRERVLPDGTYQLREVDHFDDPGKTARVHREYRNPNTGTEFVRDYWK